MLSVLVANSKGGCGKTTIATNLASAYATGGLRVALADADPQQSSLGWCIRRDDRTKIKALDWSKRIGKIPKNIDRLVIDAPAALSVDRFKVLLRMADAVLLPVLSSAFDRAATEAFIARIEALKPIRRNRKLLGIVANQVRARSKAGKRLSAFLDEIGYPPVAEIRYRTLYSDVAEGGLGLFDRGDKVSMTLQTDWTPLITFVETMSTTND